MDAEQRKITHRFEEDRDRADIFAEGAVVLKHHSEGDADHVIDQVADEEQHEHCVLVGFVKMEQQEDKD